MSLVKKIISCAAALMTVIGGALPVNAANTPVAGTKVSFDVYMIMPKGANVPDAAYLLHSKNYHLTWLWDGFYKRHSTK